MYTVKADTIRINVPTAYTLGTVAVIIPAFNEAGRIGAVVRTACQVELVQEVIIVDDGSIDATAEEALAAACNGVPVQVIRHSTNQGKGQALINGSKATRAPLLLFLDADLINLKPDHIRDLVLPVLNRQAAMSMGLFEHGRWISDLSHRLTPWLTGQRCVLAELVNGLSREAAAGYGFETALTIQARRLGWPVQSVPMHGVSHPTQLRRKGWSSVYFKVKMFVDVWRAWTILRKTVR
jgi:polyisoprenyl-phosphate glycosyltransferase